MGLTRSSRRRSVALATPEFDRVRSLPVLGLTTLKKMLDMPDVREKIAPTDMTPVWGIPEDVMRNIETDIARRSNVARRAGMQPQ